MVESAISNLLDSPTALLRAWTGGNEAALDELVALTHHELRHLARQHMARERPGHTLQPTALVNEAYLRLIDVRRIRWQNKAHFLAMASRLMRRILVESARARKAQKRGRSSPHVSIDDALAVTNERGTDVVDLDDALNRLAEIDVRKSRVVEMRFFGGMSADETAAVLQVSVGTVLRDWRFAKVWLHRELSRD